MTTKKNKNEKKKDDSAKKSPGEKLILYELIEAYPVEKSIILGALAKAGLIDQYNHELSVYEKEEIKPSITVDELTKILNDFL